MSEYPDSKQLKIVEKFPLKKRGDFVNLAYYLQDIWNNHYGWSEVKGKKVIKLTLVTGGWSGNEEILRSLDKNFMFGAVCWEMSKRGGLHKYKIDINLL